MRQKLRLSLYGLFFFIILLHSPAHANEPVWQILEEGLESTSISLVASTNSTVPVKAAVLRIEPDKFDFELLMASEYDKTLTLTQWAKEHGLIAAINASMYLPDGKTSTGYMRRDKHANNDRVVANFGAFFVAMPLDNTLPAAAVLDRNVDSWEDELDQYKIVVQNYRMMSPEGKPLWNETEKPFSIAAIGQDKKGRILFLHASQPISVYSFVQQITTVPLEVVRLMYVEGGYQAAMMVDTPSLSTVWLGKYSPYLEGGALSLLPNVLGIKRKNTAPAHLEEPEDNQAISANSTTTP